MNRSTPGLPGHHQLPEFTQTHVHRAHTQHILFPLLAFYSSEVHVTISTSILIHYYYLRSMLYLGFSTGAVVKNLPAKAGDKEMRVQSLGQEDPLE